jgi:hypothetical protein
MSYSANSVDSFFGNAKNPNSAAKAAAARDSYAESLVRLCKEKVDQAEKTLVVAQNAHKLNPSNSSLLKFQQAYSAYKSAVDRLDHARLGVGVPEPGPMGSNAGAGSAAGPEPQTRKPTLVGGMRRHRSKSRSKKQKARATRKARKARKTQRRK